MEVTRRYDSQGTHAFLGMLPFLLLQSVILIMFSMKKLKSTKKFIIFMFRVEQV